MKNLLTIVFVLLVFAVAAQNDKYSFEPMVCDTVAIDTDSVPIFNCSSIHPEYPGGEDALLKFIKTNRQYPQTAKDAGTQGNVYVSFVIMEDGSVKSPTIWRGIIGPGAKDCAAEALRIVSILPNWKPGTNNGKPVRVKYTIPITFPLR